ncbi:hypothetical protein EDB84DRAFT_1466515 [Lactarius hengduanensis]|nr:hypothetical protein EDB84DRAFT_1466515 [Lactarius hengduanensis]
MPPKARIIRKPSTAGASSTLLKATTSGAPPPAAPSSATQPPSTSSGTAMATSSKEGAMLPPPNPSPPKAVLEPELDAIAICLRNAAVKTNQIHAFFADTRRLGINNYATRPPHSLTDALGREIEKYDQLCDTVEAHLSRAIAVLQRDLDRAKAQEKAEREAEALRNRPPPEPEAVADVPGPSVPGTQKSGAGSFLAARRQSTISLSSLNRPQFPHKLDLSSATLRINPAELAQGLGGLPSPVTLAPKSGRVTGTSEFPPDFMAALAASDIANRPVDIDLTMLPEEAPAAAHVGLDVALGSSADRPIELDLEGMDIDMTNVDVSDVKTLFGDEPTSGISTTNLFGDTTEAAGGSGGNVPPSPGSLLASFNASAPHAAPVLDTSGGEPPFDMGIGEMVDFSQFQFDPMTSTSDMGMLDMNALLNIEAETAAQMDGQNGAGDT